MNEPIARFRDAYDFLSNFYPAPVEMDGLEFPTVEHAFQAAKTFDPEKRAAFQKAVTPAGAKQMGRRVQRREDWFDVSLSILEALVRQKFTRYPELARKLKATGDAPLIEGNTWNDRFYGCVWDKKQETWVGENHLGKILMKIRDELPPIDVEEVR
jgi:ribA/ribD-fused uncharacterized protein